MAVDVGLIVFVRPIETGAVSKLAVIIPGPFTNAVVVDSLFVMIMLLESVDQLENLYPTEGNADIGNDPWSTHMFRPNGFTLPVFEGKIVMAIRN